MWAAVSCSWRHWRAGGGDGGGGGGGGGGWDAVLAKVALADLRWRRRVAPPQQQEQQQQQLLLLLLPEQQPAWLPLPADGGVSALRLAPLFGGGPPETSLQWSGMMQRWLVSSIPSGCAVLQLRAAEQLTGPWSNPATVYEIPPPRGVPPVCNYSRKSHPDLAVGANELLLTFKSNSANASQLRARRGLRPACGARPHPAA